MARVMTLLVLGTACRVGEPTFSGASSPRPPADNPEGDADTDADADTDTAPPEDTGPPVDWAGNYSGTIGANVTYQPTYITAVQVFSCTGDFNVAVGSGTPGIIGYGICIDYSGVPLEMTLEGEVSGYPFASGDITVVESQFAFTDTWYGEFGGDELDADATDMQVGEPTINWYVNFTVER